MKKKIMIWICLIPMIALAKKPDIKSEILIDASPDFIWNVLVDFDRYSIWNPWIVSAQGYPAGGEKITADVYLGKQLMKVVHDINVFNVNEKFCWYDTNWYSFLGGGKRCRTLVETSEGNTLVRVDFYYKGPLSPLVKKIHGKNISKGIESELNALKKRVSDLTKSN